MTEAIFFRLLKAPIDDKGPDLAAAVAALNAGEPRAEIYRLDPAEFGQIPGSPFAYWVGKSLLEVYRVCGLIEQSHVHAGKGPDTGDDFRFLRLWWESPAVGTGNVRRWMNHPKGGAFSRFHSDTHLLIDWHQNGALIREHGNMRNPDYFFRPGLTWSRRTTSGISVRVLPAGSIFADKGPAAFVPDDDPESLLALLAIMNSAPFEALVKLQLGAAAAAARSYEVGIIQRTPVPPLTGAAKTALAALARDAHDLQRDRDRTDETTHAFGLPGLARHRQATLRQASALLDAAEQERQARLEAIQSQVDGLTFDLYGMSAEDRALVRAEMGQPTEAAPEAAEEAGANGSTVSEQGDDEAEGEATEAADDLAERVQRLLMWCVGAAFGRWDVRAALDPSRLPPRGDPFAPLPRCAPGALVGPDGLPASREWLAAQVPAYPLPIAWDGILPDDPTHPADIVARVRRVLALLWGSRADGVEQEACAILGVGDLRGWFRDPNKGFFAYHIKRYSKSRRRAPIYWLLQSERRGYGLWLYSHRLDDMTLFEAARDFGDAKVRLEESRLEEMRQGMTVLSGSSLRQRERDLDRQQKLAAEVKAFRDRLDVAAKAMLPPDLNDGVVISIAPLRELTPWKEAGQMWEKLVAGQYPWSAMFTRMKARGLVRTTCHGAEKGN